MIRILGKIPNKVVVAFSGGVDSVAVADFLIRGRKHVELAFFDHGTITSEIALGFAKEFAKQRRLKLHIGKLEREKSPDESWEEYWRNERQRFFASFKLSVVTAHHLDDAIETWIFNSLHGEPRLMPYKTGNVLHPFLITPKSEFVSWCERKDLPWVDDQTNYDTRFMRNRIRHNIVPEAMMVNPGLHKVIKKKYLALGIR